MRRREPQRPERRDAGLEPPFDRPVRDETEEVARFIGLDSGVTARRSTDEGLRRSKEERAREAQPAARVRRFLHSPPLLLRRGEPPVELPGRGLPIGMIEGASYQDESVVLAPGDRLYFYTDGATEAFDASGNEFGQSRLMAEIDRVRELPLREGLERLADSVRDWSDGKPGDDVSLLAIERVP